MASSSPTCISCFWEGDDEMTTPTYNEIRRLASQLRSETRVRSRRELGVSLLAKLKNDQILRQLAQEATPRSTKWPDEDSVAARRCRKLSGMWTSVIHSTIYVAVSLGSTKKIKVTEHDVLLPYQLLLACDRAKEFSGVESVSIPLLSQKVVCNLLKYCLDFLERDDIVQIAGLSLLDMLTVLCSKPQYLGQFQYRQDCSRVLDILYSFLSVESDKKTPTLFQKAAKTLEQFYATLKTMGLDMYPFLERTMRVISFWCNYCLEAEENGQRKSRHAQTHASSHLLLTVTYILQSYPDHSVAPMRRYGLVFFRFCRKVYPNARAQSKDVLNQYLLDHLNIGQFVGTIQGRVAGHQGDLGEATLTPLMLDQLLDLVMSDVSSHFEVRHSWTPLDTRQQRHLELAAKLLASAQQEFLCKAQWDQVDDIDEALLSSLPLKGSTNDEWVAQESVLPGPCRTDVFVQSPWKTLEQDRGTAQIGSSHTATSPNLALWQWILDILPHLENLDLANSQAPPPLAYLPIIGACAEQFPSGQCFTCDLYAGYQELVPDNARGDNTLICFGCSTKDLAVLVYALAVNLEEHGGANRAEHVQIWTLLALAKLTEVTSTHYRRSNEKPEKLESLMFSWKKVWGVIFRSDLRYHSYLKNILPNALGETVILLVGSMYWHFCTDSALKTPDTINDKQALFLHCRQPDLWRLPFFWKVEFVSSALVFDLISLACLRSGLSEDGEDQIYHQLPGSTTNSRKTRRERLILFTVAALEYFIGGAFPCDHDIVRAAVSCLCTLLSGNSSMNHYYFLAAKGSYALSSRDVLAPNRLPSLLSADTMGTPWQRACLSYLWTPHGSETSPQGSMDKFRSDICHRVSKMYQWTYHSVDFVSESDMRKHRSMVLGLMNEWATSQVPQESEATSTTLQSPLNQIVAKKILLAILFVHLDAEDTARLDAVLDTGSRLLLQHLESDSCDYTQLAHHFSQCARSILRASAATGFRVNTSLINSIADQCRQCLRKHMKTRSMSLCHETENGHPRKKHRTSKAGDDFFDDETDGVSASSATVPPVASSLLTSSDDDSFRGTISPGSRKRKRDTTSTSQGIVAKPELDSACPGAAKVLAILLLILDASLESCVLICHALLGAELDMDPEDLQGDLDARFVCDCAMFLTSDFIRQRLFALSYQKDSEATGLVKDLSIISALANIFDAARANHDALLGPSDNFGYWGVRACLDNHDKWPGVPPLSNTDLLKVQDMLKFSTGLEFRPGLRLQRAAASASLLEMPTVVSCDSFNRKALTEILRVCVHDSNMFVRRESFRLYTQIHGRQEHDGDSAHAPICRREQPKTIPPGFTAWFDQEFRFQKAEDDHVSPKDVIDLLEADAIHYKTIVAIAAGSYHEMTSVIFDIIMIPARRPDLLHSCFEALHHIALARHYTSVDLMLKQMTPDLLQFWVLGDSLEMPLTWSAPKILEQLVFCQGGTSWHGHKPNIEKLATQSFLMLLDRFRFRLVPLTFFYAIKADTVHFEKGLDDEMATKMLLKHKKFRLVCEASFKKPAGEQQVHKRVAVMLKRYVADIKAFCFTMAQHEETGIQELARISLRVLSTVITAKEVMATTLRKSRVLATRIFDFASLGESIHELMPSGSFAYHEGFNRAIAEMVPTGYRSSGDTLVLIGTNSLASLIVAFQKLENAHGNVHQSLAWNTIELHAKAILEQGGNSVSKEIQFGFLIRLLAGSTTKEHMHPLLPKLVALVRKLLEYVVGELNMENLSRNMDSLFERLVAACYITVERCQETIAQAWEAALESCKIIEQESTGLCSPPLGLPSQTRHNVASLVFRERNHLTTARNCIESISGLLDWMISHASMLSLDCQAVFRMPESMMTSPLQEIEPTLFLQGKITIFLDSLGREDTGSAFTTVHTLKRKLKSPNLLRAKSDRAMNLASRGMSRVPNLDQHILLGLLSQLEQHHMERASTASDASPELFRILIHLCSDQFPADLRIAASRCLGALQPNGVLHACAMERRSFGDKSFLEYLSKGKLHTAVQARCLESLAELLFSSDLDVARVSSQTIEALFSTKGGVRALRYVKDDFCRSLLGPFAAGVSNCDGHPEPVLLTKNEIESLATCHPHHSQLPPVSSTWCWSKEIWMGVSQMDFGDWICKLVPAIIVCCCQPDQTPDTDSMKHGDRGFYWRCQLICFTEQRLACDIFPFLLLHLMEVDELRGIEYVRNVLSELFQTMFEMLETPTGSLDGYKCRETLRLLVDTIDIFHSVSRTRFLSSKHSRNVLKVERDGSQTRNKRSYNHGILEPQPWQGIPFGTMITLSGVTIAKGCLKISRYPSALFYLNLEVNSVFGKEESFYENLPHLMIRQVKMAPQVRSTNAHMNGTYNVEKIVSEIVEIGEHCFRAMKDIDSLEAIETLNVTIQFSNHAKTLSQSRPGVDDPLDVLRSLCTRPELAASDLVLEAETMRDLGFRRGLRHYIDGILTSSQSLSVLNAEHMRMLRELWFENSLQNRQWELLSPQNGTRQGATTERILLPSNLGVLPGYFESLSGAIDSALEGDAVTCHSLLRQARLGILSEIAKRFGDDASLGVLVAEIEKLRSLKWFDILESGAMESTVLSQVGFLGTGFKSTGQLVASRFNDASHADRISWPPEIVLSVIASNTGEERLSSQRIVLAQLASLCDSTMNARQHSQPQIALESLEKVHSLLRRVTKSDFDQELNPLMFLRLEESRILESKGDFKGAIRSCQQLIDSLTQRERVSGKLSPEMQYLLIDSQVACGSWLTKYKVQHAQAVVETYLQPGAERAKRMHDDLACPSTAQRTVRASLALAKATTSLYKDILVRVESTAWKHSSNTSHHETELARCEPLLKEASTQKSKTRKGSSQHDAAVKKWEELVIYCENLKKDLGRTSRERNNVLSSIRVYLSLAITSYTTALARASTGSQDDMSHHVFEFMSLWFGLANESSETNIEVNTFMSSAFEQIPSFWFVPLTNQLFARLENAETAASIDFQSVLQGLVFTMCAEHPYHCIVPLLALTNGKNVGSGVSGRNARSFIENVGNSKVDSALAVVRRLKREARPFVVGLLKSYNLLVESYIHLAGAETSSFHKKTTKNITFSSVYPNAKTLDRCLGSGVSAVEFAPCIVTSPPALQPNGDYGGGIEDPVGGERIQGFKPTFGITETGLHRPKIVVCLGTQGGEYRQLVKGEDEIRQDAIMTQVFTFVNNIMKRREATVRGSRSLNPHSLRIITYNVVPLSPASGVLEWVEDTAAFGEIIVGKGSRSSDVGTHARYYPKEWNFLICRKHLADSPQELKRESYDVICERFSPSFRFFFMEQFGHDMLAWHSARMRYTRSVAVSSMVGHILGIGDRHTSNVLVHTKLGEVVQIDFGIVFEQGTLLHTPERVPFRLTRNVVDGMGPSGTEGTFVRSAEETIRVLRKNSNSLLTILSAVVADPLYKWSVSPVEAMRRQKPQQGEEQSQDHFQASDKDDFEMEDKNEMGRKTIAKINNKLQGYEDATSGEQQGVEGQVQLLINSARDPSNLCLMYPGWCPFV
eukprot:Nitzschia sp. Nitz4//scaffold58_size112336//77092//87879//NITZ4_004044-RA/size112336-snap-gene-0.158-mRNA-1//1//CDS//3329555022//2989//frame0